MPVRLSGVLGRAHLTKKNDDSTGGILGAYNNVKKRLSSRVSSTIL